MSQELKTVVVMGTMDTKGPELAYLAQSVREAGCRALLMDVGVHAGSDVSADIPVDQIAAAAGEDIVLIRAMPRGEAVEKISLAAATYLKQMIEAGEAHGVIGVGGSGGTTICAAAMRGLPYGIPKLIVTTLASGNTRWHIDISDIILIPSLLDIGGLNPMLEMVLNNAAHGIVGMVKGYRPYVASGKKVVSITMYGTTTPGVSRARQVLEEAGYEAWVFHASGVGGRTMEKLMSMGRIHGVMDMTLAEIGAHLVGGLHDAGPHRLEMAAQLGLPMVIVPGAADTIVLPPRDQVPEKFKNRRLNVHNPTMTTMRTTPEENVEIAKFIAHKLNQAKGPACVILPLGGISSIDRPGKTFYDPEANAALFGTLKQELSSHILVIEDEHHLDDPEFAKRVGETMIRLLKKNHEEVVMKQYTRKEVIKRLKRKLAEGSAIVAAGAGTGISARFEEEGGADLILVFNSGLYRMHGLGSLSGWMAYGNANDVSLELGEKHILPIVKEVPVICSINGTDPTKVMEVFLWKVGEAGFSGINNFPTIGMIDGTFRAALEETGMSYDKEVEMIALAHQMGFFTTAYVFNTEEARKMTKAGCDCILAHMGLTIGGAIGAKATMSLKEVAEQTAKIAKAARSVNPDVFVLCHGGPISSPSDVDAILKHAPIHGFVGASSMERIPVEKGIRETTAKFASLKIRKSIIKRKK